MAQPPKQSVLEIDESPTKQAQAKGWLWTFLDMSGDQPTNNTSELALRPAVN